MSTFNGVIASYQSGAAPARGGLADLIEERYAAKDAERSAWLSERIRRDRERMKQLVADRRRP